MASREADNEGEADMTSTAAKHTQLGKHGSPLTWDATDRVFRDVQSGHTMSVVEVMEGFAERDALRAENARLQEALADMLNWHSVQPIVTAIQHYATNRAAVQKASQARTKARAALKAST